MHGDYHKLYGNTVLSRNLLYFLPKICKKYVVKVFGWDTMVVVKRGWLRDLHGAMEKKEVRIC
jgi:hypothetical protein